MNKKLMKKAFTLVEMLIVVVIIGILIAALLPKFKGAQKSARDATRMTAGSQLTNALGSYYAANNKYPVTPSTACTNNLSTELKTFMSEMPKDPSGRTSYGTKVDGCNGTNDGYSYSSLKQGTTDNGGAFVAASLEVVGNKANAIIQDSATVVSIENNLDLSNMTGGYSTGSLFKMCTSVGGVTVTGASTSVANCQAPSNSNDAHYVTMIGVN